MYRLTGHLRCNSDYVWYSNSNILYSCVQRWWICCVNMQRLVVVSVYNDCCKHIVR